QSHKREPEKVEANALDERRERRVGDVAPGEMVRVRKELELVPVEAVAAVGGDMQQRIGEGDGTQKENVAPASGDGRIDLANLLNGSHERSLGQSFMSVRSKLRAGSFIPQGLPPEPEEHPFPARMPRARSGVLVHTGVSPAATVCRFWKAPLPFSATRRDRGPGFAKNLDKGRPGEGSNPLAGQVYQGNDCIRTANGRAQGFHPGSYGHRLRHAGTAR